MSSSFGSAESLKPNSSLDDLKKRIDDARTKADTDIRTKQGEIYPPINQKLSTAMGAVAKEKGLASMKIFFLSSNSKISRAECPVANMTLLAEMVSPF